MKLIYDPLAEDFVLQASGTLRRFHIERGQTPENCFAALELLNLLRSLTPKPNANASRPAPLGLRGSPEVEEFLAKGGQVQKGGTRTAYGINPELDKLRKQREKAAKQVTELSLEDLGL